MKNVELQHFDNVAPNTNANTCAGGSSIALPAYSYMRAKNGPFIYDSKNSAKPDHPRIGKFYFLLTVMSGPCKRMSKKLIIVLITELIRPSVNEDGIRLLEFSSSGLFID